MTAMGRLQKHLWQHPVLQEKGMNFWIELKKPCDIRQTPPQQGAFCQLLGPGSCQSVVDHKYDMGMVFVGQL